MKFVTSLQICNFSESSYPVMKLVTSLTIHFVTLMVTIFPNTTYPPILTTTPHTPSTSPTREIIACCKDTASYQQVFLSTSTGSHNPRWTPHSFQNLELVKNQSVLMLSCINLLTFPYCIRIPLCTSGFDIY